MPVFLVFIICGLLTVTCSDKKGAFFDPPQEASGPSVDYLAIASGDTNTRSVNIYTVEGVFVSILKNFRTDLGTPRGLGFIDPNELLISLDNTDRVHRLAWNGVNQGDDELFTSAGLNGAIYDLEANTSGDVYVLESNGIERYDVDGAQVGSPFIGTTTGSCVLSNPRGMFLTSDNRLIVTNHGGTDQILVYDVSTLIPTCLSNVAVGNNPYGVVLHSNGSLYFVDQGTDQVYSADADGSNAAVIFATDTTTFNNPTAIVELPNGNLAIASSGTDAVWELETSGTVVGTQPLILDALTLNITDMEVISGAD